jgi:hypothetical protein
MYFINKLQKRQHSNQLSCKNGSSYASEFQGLEINVANKIGMAPKGNIPGAPPCTDTWVRRLKRHYNLLKKIHFSTSILIPRCQNTNFFQNDLY